MKYVVFRTLSYFSGWLGWCVAELVDYIAISAPNFCLALGLGLSLAKTKINLYLKTERPFTGNSILFLAVNTSVFVLTCQCSRFSVIYMQDLWKYCVFFVFAWCKLLLLSYAKSLISRKNVDMASKWSDI